MGWGGGWLGWAERVLSCVGPEAPKLAWFAHTMKCPSHFHTLLACLCLVKSKPPMFKCLNLGKAWGNTHEHAQLRFNTCLVTLHMPSEECSRTLGDGRKHDDNGCNTSPTPEDATNKCLKQYNLLGVCGTWHRHDRRSLAQPMGAQMRTSATNVLTNRTTEALCRFSDFFDASAAHKVQVPRRRLLPRGGGDESATPRTPRQLAGGIAPNLGSAGDPQRFIPCHAAAAGEKSATRYRMPAPNLVSPRPANACNASPCAGSDRRTSCRAPPAARFLGHFGQVIMTPPASGPVRANAMDVR